jgi:hypothetical protein
LRWNDEVIFENEEERILMSNLEYFIDELEDNVYEARRLPRKRKKSRAPAKKGCRLDRRQPKLVITGFSYASQRIPSKHLLDLKNLAAQLDILSSHGQPVCEIEFIGHGGTASTWSKGYEWGHKRALAVAEKLQEYLLPFGPIASYKTKICSGGDDYHSDRRVEIYY